MNRCTVSNSIVLESSALVRETVDVRSRLGPCVSPDNLVLFSSGFAASAAS